MDETLKLLQTKRFLAFIVGILVGTWFQRVNLAIAFLVGVFLSRPIWHILAAIFNYIR